MIETNVNEFEQARLKHLLFMNKLRAILLGAEVDEEPVISEHECPFGKWIQEFALKTCEHIPELKELEQVHTQMHRVARSVVRAYHSKSDETVNAGMAEIEEMAAKILALLQRIELRCT